MTRGLRLQQAGATRICIRDAGDGPAVVLLHGTTANLGVWDAVVEILGTDVRTIAVDQRGHGRSDKPSSGYGMNEYTHDLAELVEALDCGPVVVVGHSLGARNAVVLGARRPDLVAGVVAVDYTPFVEPEVLDDLQARVAGGDRHFATRTELMEYLRDRYTLITDDAVRRRADYGYVADERGLRPLAAPGAMEQTVDGLRTDFLEEARTIGVPVTLIRGQLSRIVSDQAFARTRTLRPDFHALELPGVDHYVPEERPDVVAEAVAQMLARTPAGRTSRPVPTSQS